MARDISRIGLTARGRDLLTRLTDQRWFSDAQDAAKFCMGYAIRAKVPAGTTEGTTTAWTVSLFDDTGEIRALVRVLYPDCDTPVRLIEHLVNEGLLLLEDRLKAGNLTPVDLLR
jgi:hypothetical protein